MKYFDFHVHTVLKQVFQDQPNIDTQISQNDVGGLPRLCTDLPYIIETQIHQSQLSSFQDEVVVGAVLYGLESNLAAEVIPLRQYLKGDAQSKLSLPLLTAVSGTGYATFNDFVIGRILNLYLQAGASFNFLGKDSFNAPLPAGKVNIFFAVEGCHSLVNTTNRVSSPTQGYAPAEILANLDTLLAKIKIVSVNPTHLQQSNLCNHAFGIQLTQTAPFYPLGNGLTDDGRKVIQGLFDRGIGVDLKHMSYKSRLDLRTEISDGKFTGVQSPRCTHAGFTGVAFADWPGYITLKKPVTGDVLYLEIAKTKQIINQPRQPGAPSFNLSTINLFNEDIEWIVRNQGMIGLSMDRRILGYVGPFDDTPTGIRTDAGLVVDKEYFSRTEWDALGITDDRIGKAIQPDDCVQIEEIKDIDSGPIPERDEYFYDHILLHIKHFFQVCVNAGIPVTQAQQHICIGSDFDGIINPFINNQTCLDMPALKQYIGNNLSIYLKSLTDSRQWADQLNITQFAEDLFYNNGFQFIKNFFTK